MNSAFVKLWEAIKSAFYEIGSLIILNLLWVLFSVTILLLPAATSALFHSVRTMMAGEADYSHKVFFKGLKIYLFRGWRWFLPNLLLIILFTTNLVMFWVENTTITILVKAGNLALLMVWLWFQTFLLPLMMEQEEASVRLALRNALVVFVKRPAIYVVTTLFIWVFLIVSVILMMPWVLISISFCAYVAMYMLRVALAEMNQAENPESKV